MSEAAPRRTIGNRIAPVRFIAFVFVLLAALPLGRLLLPDFPRSFMAAFDLAAFVFLLLSLSLLREGRPQKMRADALENDASRVLLLVFTGIVIAAILAVIMLEVSQHDALPWDVKAWVLATLLLAWLFGNTIYALHYAHLAYLRANAEGCGGVEFPGTREPVYSDFVYFAFTLGMTFQTSDVTIADPGIRKAVTFHCLAAFFFNIGVLAFTINVLGR